MQNGILSKATLRKQQSMNQWLQYPFQTFSFLFMTAILLICYLAAMKFGLSCYYGSCSEVDGMQKEAISCVKHVSATGLLFLLVQCIANQTEIVSGIFRLELFQVNWLPAMLITWCASLTKN